jgi:KRAB domain-containing zinc finger protein
MFKSKAKLVSHSRNHKFSKKYSCNQCSAQFFKEAVLRQHSLICSKSNVNNLNVIYVPAPQKQAQIVTDVKNVEKEYKCLECGKIFSNYKYLYGHKKIHEGIIYRCVECPSTYKSSHGLRYHSKTEHELRRFECHHCHTTFKQKNSLITHMSVHFNSIKKDYKCLECRKIFSNYQTFYKHKKMHAGIIYRCVQCPSTYKSISGLTIHLKTEHELRRFECHHCHTTFKTKNSLVIHMSVHFNSIEKDYKCLECRKIFSNYQTFYKHKKMHAGIIYRCVQCPSTYPSSSGLQNHSKTVHELRKFECHHCQTTFKSKYSLKIHMSLHSSSINAPLHHHTLICPKSNVNNLNYMDVPAPQQKQAQVVTDIKNV